MIEAQWREHEMERRIRELLTRVHVRGQNSSRPTRPFVTSYQLAIMFEKEYSDVCERLNLLTGGKSTTMSNTLAGDIGKTLSRKIRDGEIRDMDYKTLSCQYLIGFKGVTVDVSPGGPTIAMFRMRV